MKPKQEILTYFMQIVGQDNKCFFKLKNGQECDGVINAVFEKYLEFAPWYYSKEWQDCEYEKQFLRDEDNEDEEIDFILIPLNDIDLTNLYYWNKESWCFIRLEWNVTQNGFTHNETVPGTVPLPTYLQEDIPEDDKHLKAVGYWQSDSNRPYYPHPKYLLKQRWRKSERNQIIAYLKAGHRCGCWHGRYTSCNFGCFNIDRFEKLNQIEKRKLECEMLNMGSHYLLTDGEWVWTEGLAHYIEKHDICLPDEFILTMQKNSWSVPQNMLDFQKYQQIRTNVSFWINWAIKYTQTN